MAGKDEISLYLVNKYGFKQVSFAEPIYWICRNLLFMRKKNRKLLQLVGQVGRFIYKDIWVVLTFWKAKRLLKQGYSVVISDCRQANEYLQAVKHGFYPIRVSAIHAVRVKRAIKRDGSYPDVSLWENSSENGADGFSYYEIENSTSLEELHRQIDKMLKVK